MRLWEVTLSFAGTNHDRTGRDNEEMMERAGLGDDFSDPLLDQPIPYPFTSSSSRRLPVIAGTIARSIAPRLQVAVAVGLSDLGETMGRRNGGTGFQSDDWYLTVGATSTSAAVLVRRGGMLHLGAGPSLHWIEYWTGGDGQPRETRHAARLGLALEAGASAPAHRRFFVDASIRYHWIGALRRGPFEPQSTQGTMTVPESAIRLDHWLAALGLGVRL